MKGSTGSACTCGMLVMDEIFLAEEPCTDFAWSCRGFIIFE
jgi:hypothetical protein